MRISHRHRFIFFARPKTGSSSLRQFLNPYSDVLPVKNHLERTPDNPFYPHMRPIEVREQFRARGWNFEGYTKFVCARNPWARIVSLYRHVQEASPETPDFSQWLLSLDPDGAGGGGEDWQRWRRYGSYTLESYVGDEQGSPLVDVILRLEDTATELRPFLETLGLPGLAEREIPHSNNRAQGESYTRFYDEASRDRVAALYRGEIKQFGYVFGD